MKMLSWIVLALGLALAGSTQAEAPAGPRKKIYDTQADGNKQIAEALQKAQKERKRVLLQFGANWCGWCHKLSGLFESDKEIAAFLQAHYVLVLIDVDQTGGKPHNADVAEKYGNPPQFGLPALAVLDAEGKLLTVQDSGELEKGNAHDPAKVLEFLRKWANGKDK